MTVDLCCQERTLSQSQSLISMSSEADKRYGRLGCTARLLHIIMSVVTGVHCVTGADRGRSACWKSPLA